MNKLLRRSAFKGPFSFAQKVNQAKWILVLTFPFVYAFGSMTKPQPKKTF
eukprot:gene10764-3383_t